MSAGKPCVGISIIVNSSGVVLVPLSDPTIPIMMKSSGKSSVCSTVYPTTRSLAFLHLVPSLRLPLGLGHRLVLLGWQLNVLAATHLQLLVGHRTVSWCVLASW